VIDESIRAVAEARGDGEELPVYQATVWAEPLTSDVAELSGEPDTRNGGWTAVTGCVGKPSAAKVAGFELVTDRLAAFSVCSVMAPPSMVEGVEVPVIESILDNSV